MSLFYDTGIYNENNYETLHKYNVQKLSYFSVYKYHRI